jgi:hypothetical protein
MSDLVLLDKAMKLYERYDNSSDTFEYLQYIAGKFKETDFKIAVYLLDALYNGYSESELIEFDNRIVEAVKLLIRNENAENSFMNEIKENEIARQIKIFDLQEQIDYYKRLNKDVAKYEYTIIEQLNFLQN